MIGGENVKKFVVINDEGIGNVKKKCVCVYI